MHHRLYHNEKALVIGSGIGGLSMAIILAKLGFRVTVIEKNRQPGGMLRSYVRRGIHCNVGLHYMGALGEGQVLRRLFDYLGITEKLPLEPMGQKGTVDRYYFTNATAGPRQFDMPVGFDTYASNLKESFPKDHHAIDGFMTLLHQSAGELDRLDFLFKNQSAAAIIDQTEPLWHVLDQLGCSPGLKSVLSVPSVWIGVPPPMCPQFYHTMTLASYLFSAWRLTTNGTHMAKVLAQQLKDLGGKIICGTAARRINVKNGCAAGLTLENGEQHESSLVVGTVHPGIIVDLLGPENTKPSYSRRIRGLVNTSGMFAQGNRISQMAYELL